jgi:hypothetical protein
MTERQQKEPDLEALEIDANIVGSSPEAAPNMRKPLGWRSAVALPLISVLGIFVLAEAEATHHDNFSNDSLVGKTEQPTTYPTTSITLAPSLSGVGPSYYGPACSSEERTIKPGDTLFGLSTAGMQGNDAFTNEVFGWNLNYVKEQSKKDSELVDPDNIPIGHKLKIETDCIDVEGVHPVRGYTNFDYSDTNSVPPVTSYERRMTYQNYQGTDKKTHHLVTVNYETDKQGKPEKVEYCEPVPDCYAYVAGAPDQPPDWQWTP